MVQSWRRTLSARIARALGKRAGRNLPITLTQNRIYVLPSGFGVALAITLFVAALGALNYNNNLALAFSFLFAALAFLSVHISHRNLLRVQLSHLNMQPAYAGGELQVDCRFIASDQRPRTCLQARFEDGPLLDFELPDLADVSLRAPALKRGLMPLPPILLRTDWPFGMFVLWSHLWPEAQALIYPRLEENPPGLPENIAPRAGHSVASGEEDLRHLRDYRMGDPPRRIAWKASARRSQLLTRELEAPQSADVVLSWDATAGLDYERRIARLAAWCHQAQQQRRHFALQLPQASVPRDAGPEQLHRCLRALALMP
jgi:uncharacterized protein (DUF58 family)